MLISTLICLGSALTASAIPMSTRDTDNDPNKAAVDVWLADTNDTAPLIIGSKFYTKLDTPSGLDKRDCDAHVENNVDRTGNFWGEWSKVSGCQFASDSEGEMRITVDTSQTITTQVSKNFDIGLSSPEIIAKIVNAKAGFNLGHTWSTAKTTTDSVSCTIPKHSVGSVWQRNLMGWADTAQRNCSCDGCSPWKFGHITFPLDVDSKTSRDMGCSTGKKAKCW